MAPAPVSRRSGDPSVEDPERASPLPLRATGIVISVWVVVMVFAAFVVVPLLFATCFPSRG